MVPPMATENPLVTRSIPQPCRKNRATRRDRRTRLACALLLALLLGTPLVAQADQIAPNPNPAGDTITVSGSDLNDVYFINNGDMDITGSGVLDNTGRLESYGTLGIDAGGTLHNSSAWSQVWNYGTLTNAGSLVNSSGATLNNDTGGTLENTGALSNSGTINSYAAFTNSGTIHNYTGGEIYNYSGSTFTNSGTLINDDWFESRGTLNNSGAITSSGWLANRGAWNNTGVLETSGIVYNYLGGAWTNDAAGSMTNSGDVYNWGNFINNGILTNSGMFKNSFWLGVFTNDGELRNSGTFDNDGTFSGSGVFVNDGGTIDNSGAMSIATLVVHSGYTGAITGTSAASVTTANVGGTLDFTGSGGLSVTTLNLAGGAFTNNGGGNVDIGTTTVATGSSGDLGGTGDTSVTTANVGGTLNYTGSGGLSVTSLNLTGGTFTNNGTGSVDIGTATVAADSTGLISGSGSIELATADVDGTLTVSAALTGAGSLTKTGTGLLRLSGTNTYTGATSVDEGSLAVDGSITSDVTVDTDATLMGVGTIFGDVVNNGTIAPGNSIGTLTINGDYTQNAGSTYEVEVNAAGESDTLVIGGTATLNDGTVSVLADTGTYNLTTNYTILSATGGLTGTFDDVTSNLAFLTPSLSYDATSAYLTLTRNSTNFANVAATANQYAVASALDRGTSSASGDMTTVYNNLLGLSASGARSAYDQTGGLTHSALTEVSSFALDGYLSVLSSRIRERSTPSLSARQPLLAFLTGTATDASPVAASGRAMWMTAYANRGDRDGDDISSRYGYTTGGVALGYDQKITPDFLLGASAGYGTTSLDMDDLDDRAEVSLYQASLYGSYAAAKWYATAIATYGYSHYDTTRRIVFGGLNRTARATYDGHTVLGQVEAGRHLDVETVTITPFASLEAAHLTRNAFTESGAGALNLSVDKEYSRSLISALGVKVEKEYETSRGVLTPEARLSWRHQFWDTDQQVSATFVGAPAASFSVRSEDSGRESAVAGLGLSWAVRKDLALAAGYEATIATDRVQHLGVLMLNHSW